MSVRRRPDDRQCQTEPPDDFAQRLERLRKSSGLTWRGFARALGVSLRSVHRWRAGGQPNAAHLLALVRFAAEAELLDVLLEQELDEPSDVRQAVLFEAEAWRRLRRTDRTEEFASPE